MKKIFVLLLFLSSLAACKNTTNKDTVNVVQFNRDSNIIRRVFPPSEYVKTTVKLLELKKEYYPMFDSIVFKSITTPVNRVKKIGFGIGVYPFNENTYNMYIYPLEYRIMSLSIDEAVFYFNGFQFNYDGHIIKEIFKYEKDTVLFRVNPNLWYQYSVFDDGDAWHYTIKNGKVSFESKFLLE